MRDPVSCVVYFLQAFAQRVVVKSSMESPAGQPWKGPSMLSMLPRRTTLENAIRMERGLMHHKFESVTLLKVTREVDLAN